jgi:putative thioredoxin
MVKFENEVIEKSFETPVLVDFWAPWCGPCRVLGPVLEQLASEQADRWELVKVNTEEQPELAQQYQVMSIPAVKLFSEGKVIQEFTGALPRFQIENWLRQHLPDPSSRVLRQILSGTEAAEVEAALRGFIAEHPEHNEAKLALARKLVFLAPKEVDSLTAGIHASDPWHSEASDLKALARLMMLESPGETQAAGLRLLQARTSLQQDDFDTALQLLIEATTLDKSYQGDLPRKASVALFHFLGDEHELTRKYRRRFDMALY